MIRMKTIMRTMAGTVHRDRLAQVLNQAQNTTDLRGCEKPLYDWVE